MSHVVLDFSEGFDDDFEAISSYTYAHLKASIADHLDRDDLVSQIDGFIQVAEAAHRRDVRIREMIRRQELTLNSRHVLLPEGTLEVLSLRSPRFSLSEVSIHDIFNLRRGSGQPAYFAIYGRQIELDAQPDAEIAGEIIFYKALRPLSDEHPVNALLAVAPDVYLYGALAASAPFLMNDERIQIWGGLYSSAVAGLDRITIASRRVGPLVSRIHGATP